MKNKFDKNYYSVTVIFLIISFVLMGLVFYKIITERSFEAADTYSSILFIVCIIYALYKYIKDKKHKK